MSDEMKDYFDNLSFVVLYRQDNLSFIIPEKLSRDKERNTLKKSNYYGWIIVEDNYDSSIKIAFDCSTRIIDWNIKYNQMKKDDFVYKILNKNNCATKKEKIYYDNLIKDVLKIFIISNNSILKYLDKTNN